MQLLAFPDSRTPSYWTPPAAYGRFALMGLGALCVLIGAADVSSRIAAAAFGENARVAAFAPAAALDNPFFAATMPAGGGAITPTRLKIPSLGVNALVEAVGQKSDGSMATPKKFGEVGWYSPGVKPGSAGSAVFAGHVNNALTEAGVFEHLSDIKLGDYVTVEDAGGRTLVFVVTETAEYGAPAAGQSDAALLQSLFTQEGPAQIVLITCDGDWVPSERTFDKRFVAIAKRVP